MGKNKISSIIEPGFDYKKESIKIIRNNVAQVIEKIKSCYIKMLKIRVLFPLNPVLYYYGICVISTNLVFEILEKKSN